MRQHDPAACVARLTSLLAEETSRLGRSEVASAIELVEEKQRMASAVRDYAADGSLRSIPDVAVALGQLRHEIDLNKHALEHALRVQRVLLGIIAEATRRAVPVQSYGRGGIALMQRSARMLGSCRA